MGSTWALCGCVKKEDWKRSWKDIMSFDVWYFGVGVDSFILERCYCETLQRRK
jgi:hypothetical protein